MEQRKPKPSFPLWAPALIFAAAALTACSVTIVSQNGDPSLTGADSITGRVVDDSTNQDVAGATVALEQSDTSGIDRVLQTVTTGADGSFSFNGLAAGDYDLVSDASLEPSDGTAVTYAATVTLQVPTGTALPRIPLMPEFGNSFPNGVPAQIAGVVSTSGSTGAVEVDVKLSALQQAATTGGTSIEVTVPPFAGSTINLTTAFAAACSLGAACANYSLLVPSSDPVVGTFNPSGTGYQFPSASPTGPVEVIYSIEGRAFIHGSASTPDCTPSTQTIGPVVPRGTLASVIPNLTFTGCQ